MKYYFDHPVKEEHKMIKRVLMALLALALGMTMGVMSETTFATSIF